MNARASELAIVYGAGFVASGAERELELIGELGRAVDHGARDGRLGRDVGPDLGKQHAKLLDVAGEIDMPDAAADRSSATTSNWASCVASRGSEPCFGAFALW